MAKRRKGARTAQQRRFGVVAKAAIATCRRPENSGTSWGACLRREMKAGLGGRKRKGGRKGRK